MVEQQVRNILRHLRDAHQIEKHPMVKAILPKGTPPFPELDELMALRARVESLERDVGGLVGGDGGGWDGGYYAPENREH